jgi:hypothetical protein
MLTLKCGPRRIDNKRAKNEESNERLRPPKIAPGRLAKAAAGDRYQI